MHVHVRCTFPSSVTVKFSIIYFFAKDGIPTMHLQEHPQLSVHSFQLENMT
jgi:hypothetical protein